MFRRLMLDLQHFTLSIFSFHLPAMISEHLKGSLLSDQHSFNTVPTQFV